MDKEKLKMKKQPPFPSISLLLLSYPLPEMPQPPYLVPKWATQGKKATPPFSLDGKRVMESQIYNIGIPCPALLKCVKERLKRKKAPPTFFPH